MNAVYAAINAVMHDIGVTGISKARKNQQQGYSFRGIDDVYNELNSLLSKHKLIVAPRILSRQVIERETQRGGALFYVTVEAEFDLVSVEDGSKHTIRTFGEAMDSADKATNKAMSAAYKYAAMMVFCIPTEGDNDADAVTHEVVPRKETTPPPQEVSAAEMKRGLAEIEKDLLDCHTVADVNRCAKIWAALMDRDGWTKDYRDIAAPKFGARREAIRPTEAEEVFPGDRVPSNNTILGAG
jgi:hypothetical protein